MNIKNSFRRFIVRGLSLTMTAVMCIISSGVTPADAGSIPYISYNYDYRENIHYTPAPYIPFRTVKGTDFTFNGEPIGEFRTPKDICKAPSGEVYLADTGNNRIIVFSADMSRVTDVIDSFENGGKTDKFSQPYGVCVSDRGNIYIADSKKKRIVVLDPEHSLLQTVDDPRSEVLGETFIFTPLKVAVDYADRIYCIAQNMFEGIMVFETDGSFSGFFGTIPVPISMWQKFWKRIATKEERSKQQLYIPTEFTGIDVDPEGFVYASNIDANGKQGVRRLNPRGEDVIRKGENENVGGDLITDGRSDYSGASQFTDVVYRDNGIYSCLDRLRGRIFTYDHEGNLLYIFGGLGTSEGTFDLPAAIEQIGDSMAVVDSNRGSVIFFAVTEYGDLINRAVALRYDGDEAQAVGLWERVLELDEDNELANTGIGKAYLTAGDYSLAMKYLRLGMNRDYYSIAYKRYRNAILTHNIGYFLTAAVVLIAVLTVVKKVKKRRGGELADG